MPRKCPTGFICSDQKTLIILVALFVGSAWLLKGVKSSPPPPPPPQQERVIVINREDRDVSLMRPDLYPEPVLRSGFGAGLATRGPAPPYQQMGILTAEGGSSSSAAPDRTILPLYGREMDVRRGRWNYYTRTDGTNPIQVPIRVKNRFCDDDTNGCDELYNDDTVHIPALGRSFTATVYRRSIFG